ncbi:MAG: nuclear transport factor 2 family protein [Pseudomonadota bacterium]
MNETSENAARLREAFAAWAADGGASIGMWRDYMHDDIRLFSLADGETGLQFTRQRRGYSQVVVYLEGLIANFRMNSWEIFETVSEGDRVVGIGRCGWTHRITGKSFLSPIVVVTRWRDGKMTEYGEYYDTAQVAGTLPD